MEEKRKTSDSAMKAIKKYRSKLVLKQITFNENELGLLDKANDAITRKKTSFNQYVKDLIKDDVSDSE